MADKIQWASNTMPKSDDKHLGIMSLDHVKKARAFHQSFPQYTVTPLARLDGQAARLGLSNLCVKDESYRFGLNAFKVLGGSFAMANYIADETGKDVAECTFDYLTSDQLAKDFGQASFFTATDGNHGFRGCRSAARDGHQPLDARLCPGWRGFARRRCDHRPGRDPHARSDHAELKELIGLDKTSSVLCFSTEGGTDPDQYRRIVWEGEYPTCQQIDLSGRRSK